MDTFVSHKTLLQSIAKNMFKYTRFTTHIAKNIRTNSIITTAAYRFGWNRQDIIIPIAYKILSKEEHEKYILYRSIKSGNIKFVENYFRFNNLSEEEKISLIKYVKTIINNPINYVNYIIGAASQCVGIGSIIASIQWSMRAVPLILETISNGGCFGLGVAGIGFSTVYGIIGCKLIYFGYNINKEELKNSRHDHSCILNVVESDGVKNITAYTETNPINATNATIKK